MSKKQIILHFLNLIFCLGLGLSCRLFAEEITCVDSLAASSARDVSLSNNFTGRMPLGAVSSVVRGSQLLEEIADVTDSKELKTELNSLMAKDPNSLVLETGLFSVYIARAKQIPNILREIGRLREITFRNEGEGSGHALDLDKYDEDYEHIFLWSKSRNEIAGAVRLGTVSHLIAKHGREGLYSYSLFHYETSFFDYVGESIELGRAFVIPKYQRSSSSGLLMYAIVRVLMQRPQIKSLFGPVSISAEYSEVSTLLMIKYLMGRHGASSEIKSLASPTHPYNENATLMRGDEFQNLLNQVISMNSLNSLVSSLEEGGRTVPPLISFSTRMGAQYLSFSVDPAFNTIDGLFVVDTHSFLERLLVGQ